MLLASYIGLNRGTMAITRSAFTSVRCDRRFTLSCMASAITSFNRFSEPIC